MTLNRTELAVELERITYKPGFRFTLFDHPHEGVWLRITARVLDTMNPHDHFGDRFITLGIDVPVPPFDTPEQFHRWLHWRLTRHEIHETCEWFKVDGQPPYNPHQPT